MASKRAVKRRACGDKRKYADEAEAASAARHQGQRTGAYLHWYRCPHCHFFHLGHLPKRVRQSIRDRRRAALV